MLLSFFTEVRRISARMPIGRVFWYVLLGMLLRTTEGLAQPPGASPDNVRQLFEEAQRYHLGIGREVDLRQALRYYEEVIKRDPRHKDACYNLAYLWFEQKRYDRAATYYQKVVTIDPEDSDAYNNLGTVFQRQGNLRRAKAMYVKAARLNRDLGVAFFNLANLFLLEGDEDKALLAIEQALKGEPDNPDFIQLYAKIKGERGKISNGMIGVVVSAFVGVLVVYYVFVYRKGV